jgi:hypothetical protein
MWQVLMLNGHGALDIVTVHGGAPSSAREHLFTGSAVVQGDDVLLERFTENGKELLLVSWELALRVAELTRSGIAVTLKAAAPVGLPDFSPSEVEEMQERIDEIEGTLGPDAARQYVEERVRGAL